jgi:hypothetical protein
MNHPKRLKSRSIRHILQSLCAMTLLGSLALAGCSLPAGVNQGFQTQAVGVLADYLLKVSESFSVKAVDPLHQAAINDQVKSFESDLSGSLVDEYYQNPSFSILLAAGSEGSFFNSKEGIETIGKTGAVFARVVVFDPGEALKSFKGQFSNGRFYFAGKEQAVFSSLNTAYLISLDLNLETKIFKGQLVAGSEGSFIRPGEGLPAELVAGSEGSFLRAPSPEVIADKIKSYQGILLRNTQQGAEFGRKVGEFKIVPPDFPLGLAWTETYARLLRAYPEEMTMMMQQVRGLPRGQLDEAFEQFIERYTVRYIADCGAPPPDGGVLYPQRGGQGALAPPGYQTEALDKVLKELPELVKELTELAGKRLPPDRFEPAYVVILNKYRAQDPEVFARHQWADVFAPPDCVKPRKRKLPPPGN